MIPARELIMDIEKIREALYQAHGGPTDARRVQATVNMLTDPEKETDLDPELSERELQAVAGQMASQTKTDCPICSEPQDSLPEHLLDDH